MQELTKGYKITKLQVTYVLNNNEKFNKKLQIRVGLISLFCQSDLKT